MINSISRCLGKIMVVTLMIAGVRSAFADETRVVEASYRYIIPENCSQAEAKAIACEHAIQERLAQEYGTTIQAETWSEIRNTSIQSYSDVWRVGSSSVRGQWIETIGEPIYHYVSDGKDIVLEVKIKGRIAPIADTSIDLDIKVLRAAKEGVFESGRFLSGDRLEVQFVSPIDGALLIFLSDEEGNVSQLLPFQRQKEGCFDVKGGEKYRLFSDNTADWAEQYILYTDQDIERNLLYVLFSPKSLIKPISSKVGNINTLDSKRFREWISERRNRDKDFQYRVFPITILGE